MCWRVRAKAHFQWLLGGLGVQGGFHTICAKDIGTGKLFLNIKESPETLMVRRLSFMKVLNLCFFEQHHWGRHQWLQLPHLEIDTE